MKIYKEEAEKMGKNNMILIQNKVEEVIGRDKNGLLN
jgi:hypothetical protein